MAIEVEGLDVALLRSEIQRTYADVSTQPDQEFIFPTGRAWALDLGYPQDLLARVPGRRVSRSRESRTRSRWERSSPVRTFSTSAPARAWTRW